MSVENTAMGGRRHDRAHSSLSFLLLLHNLNVVVGMYTITEQYLIQVIKIDFMQSV